MRPLCIYHGNCADGFTAAWVVNKFFNGDVDLYAGTYNDPPPKIVLGTPVIFVDFSYKRAVMLEFVKGTGGILMLDHHKSAMEDMVVGPEIDKITDISCWSRPIDWRRVTENFELDVLENTGPHIYTYFDMERSGAGLTWDFFFPGKPRPELLNHVEDRDLWRFKLPHTREISAALFSYEYGLSIWSALMGGPITKLIKDGEALERKHHKDIDELLRVVTRRMVIAGYEVPVANLPYTYASDAGAKLASPGLFGACYWDTPKGRVFSLRSTDEGLDVQYIAKQYGGGGHRNAAGFRVTFEQAREMELPDVPPAS